MYEPDFGPIDYVLSLVCLGFLGYVSWFSGRFRNFVYIFVLPPVVVCVLAWLFLFGS